MTVFKNLKTCGLIGSLALLTACGGGGGGGTPAANVPAEGVWTGTTSSGYAIDVLVLENNQFWSMFGNRSGGALSVIGFDQGSGSVSGSTFNGNLLEVLYTGVTGTGSITATTVANTSLNGSASYSNGNTSTFNLAPPTSGTYNYNTAANLSTIQGNWSGSLLSGAAATVAITSGGAITGTSGGCSFTGTATPRASGKNVFDTSITFGASPCALPNQTATGIALAYTTTANQTQLLVSVVDSGRTTGTMFFAHR